MNKVRTLNMRENRKEMMNLQRVAKILSTLSDDDIYYTVRDCYIDQDNPEWMMTTIIAHYTDVNGSCYALQAINTDQWKDIVSAETKDDLLDIVKRLLK